MIKITNDLCGFTDRLLRIILSANHEAQEMNSINELYGDDVRSECQDYNIKDIAFNFHEKNLYEIGLPVTDI